MSNIKLDQANLKPAFKSGFCQACWKKDTPKCKPQKCIDDLAGMYQFL